MKQNERTRENTRQDGLKGRCSTKRFYLILYSVMFYYAQSIIYDTTSGQYTRFQLGKNMNNVLHIALICYFALGL